MNTRFFTALRMTVVCLAATACTSASARERAQLSDADLLHGAVHDLSDVIVYDIFTPPQASRAYSYASIAAYEALRPAHPEYRTLAGVVSGLTTAPAPQPGVLYSWPLASVHAFMTVGRAITFSQPRMDSLRTVMDGQFRHRKGMSKEIYDRSIGYGEQIANHILTWSKTDHYLQTRGMPKYSVTRQPGRWIPTPAYMEAVEPNWAKIRPLVMDSASEFQPLRPIPFDTSRTSRYFRDVRDVYHAVKNITPEQRALTSFWDCNPYVMHVQGHAVFATKKITPGGHWMEIVAIASRKARPDMMQSAEAYARTSIALADVFISSWDAKYTTNMIRPETVINKYLDESWEPVLQTPPFPEYTSGHRVISTAAAQVLTNEFGSSFAFMDSTEMEFGLPARSFTSFEQAAGEAAISGLYGGIHYRWSIEQGALQGRKVGQLVVKRLPAHKEPSMVATAPVRSAVASPARH